MNFEIRPFLSSKPRAAITYPAVIPLSVLVAGLGIDERIPADFTSDLEDCSAAPETFALRIW